MSRSSPSSGSPLKAEDHPEFPWSKNLYAQSAWRIGWEVKNKLREVPLGIKKGYLGDFLNGFSTPTRKANDQAVATASTKL